MVDVLISLQGVEGGEEGVEGGDVRSLVLLLLLPVLLPVVGRVVRTEGEGVRGLLLVPELLSPHTR